MQSSGLFSDIVSAFGYNFAGVAGAGLGAAIGRLLDARTQQGREILVEEIRRGDRLPRDVGEAEEFVAIVYRYLRASQEGAARLNLRLMAKVIQSQAESASLYANDFLRYADMIASLTREEVTLLATYLRCKAEFRARNPVENYSDDQAINQEVNGSLCRRSSRPRTSCGPCSRPCRGQV